MVDRLALSGAVLIVLFSAVRLFTLGFDRGD